MSNMLLKVNIMITHLHNYTSCNLVKWYKRGNKHIIIITIIIITIIIITIVVIVTCLFPQPIAAVTLIQFLPAL